MEITLQVKLSELTDDKFRHISMGIRFSGLGFEV